MNRLLYLLAVVLLAAPLHAGKVRVRLPDTTLVHTPSFTMPVYVDSSLTGRNVTAFQLRILFSASLLDVDSVLTQGTLTAGAGSYVFNGGAGFVSIAWAGTTPLSGTGVLVRIRFRPKQTGSTSMYFPDTVSTFFNENNGNPGVDIRNGSVWVQQRPSISISPGSVLLAVGEQQQYSGSGGSGPYTWSVTNPSVASISTGGMLTAVAAGRTRIVAQDTSGNSDTSSGEADIRAFRMTVGSVSAYPRTEVLVPVTTTSLTGVGIVSGTVVIGFSNAILSPVGVDVAGTPLDGHGSVSVDTTTAGRISFAFAGTTPLSGSGTLFSIRLRVNASASFSTSLSVQSAVFNESIVPKVADGYFTLQSAGTPSVSPSTASLMAGDSVQFTGSSGLPPYRWSTTDSSIASISPSGRLRGLRSGVVRVIIRDSLGSEGMSGDVVVYGAAVSLPTRSAPRGVIIDVPLMLDRLVLGGVPSVSGMSVDIRIDTSVLRFRGIVTAGTLTDGWSFAVDSTGNRIALAGANASGFSSAGTIVTLRIETRSTVTFGAASSLQFQSITLNEGDPSAKTTNGYISVVAPPAAPVLWSPSDGQSGVSVTPSLGWFTASGAESYRLQLSTDSLFGTLLRNDSLIVSTSRTVGPLPILQVYYWRVRAVNGAGQSPWSSFWRFTTQGISPAQVVLVTPADSAVVTADSVVVSWNRSSPDIISYDAEWSTSPSFATASVDSNRTDTTTVFRSLTAGSYWWRVRARNAAGFGPYSDVRMFTVSPSTGITGDGGVPDGYALMQNHPNPFNPSTRIAYHLPGRSIVTLTVYNAVGQPIAVLSDGEQPAGWHTAVWRADVASGAYFYRLVARDAATMDVRYVGKGKMLLLK